MVRYSITNGLHGWFMGGCQCLPHERLRLQLMRTQANNKGQGLSMRSRSPFFGDARHRSFRKGGGAAAAAGGGKKKSIPVYPPQMSLTLERRWTAVHVSSIPRVSILLSVGGRLSPLCGRACRRGESAKERTRHALQERGHSEVGRDGRVIGRLGRIAHLGESWWG